MGRKFQNEDNKIWKVWRPSDYEVLRQGQHFFFFDSISKTFPVPIFSDTGSETFFPVPISILIVKPAQHPNILTADRENTKGKALIGIQP